MALPPAGPAAGARRRATPAAPETALDTAQRRLLLALLGGALGIGLAALQPPRDAGYWLAGLALGALLMGGGAWLGGRPLGARLDHWLLLGGRGAQAPAGLPGTAALPRETQAALARAMLPGWRAWLRRARLGAPARARAASLLAALEAAPAPPPEALALPRILAALRQGDPAGPAAAEALIALCAAPGAAGPEAALAAALGRLRGGAAEEEEA